MLYGTVEILVFAGLLELWDLIPGERGWLLPVFAIHAVAILVSLTRMLWVCTLAMLCVHLAWRRSRSLWAVPAVACIAFWIAPSAVRARVTGNVGIYHLQACRSYPGLGNPDRWFCSEEDAQAAGFRRAYNCRPPKGK